MTSGAYLFAFMALCTVYMSVYAVKSIADEELDPIKSSNEFEQPMTKRFDSFTNGFGHSKRGFDEINRSSFGFNKRPFDEIGRSSFGFNKRRNFDEIGRSSFNFNKRDFDEIDRHAFGFVKRGDFDEIGRSSFGFYRRSPPVTQPFSRWRFFSGFGKRDGAYLPEPAEKRSFDEINRNSFGFNSRK